MTALTSHGRRLGHYHLLEVAVAVAAVYNNAIIMIGGCTNASIGNAKSSSLTVVELGQAELLH